MDLAIKLLYSIEETFGAEIPNTGWRNGFGLEVSVGVPIRLSLSSAELETDGSDIVCRRLTGSKYEFDEVCQFLLARAESESEGAT